MPKEWIQVKGLVFKLYVLDWKPIQEVRRLIRDTHQFDASIRSYRNKIDEWGFTKQKNKEHARSSIVQYKSPSRKAAILPSKDSLGQLECILSERLYTDLAPEAVETASTLSGGSTIRGTYIPTSGSRASSSDTTLDCEMISHGSPEVRMICGFESSASEGSQWHPREHLIDECMDQYGFSSYNDPTQDDHAPRSQPDLLDCNSLNQIIGASIRTPEWIHNVRQCLIDGADIHTPFPGGMSSFNAFVGIMGIAMHQWKVIDEVDYAAVVSVFQLFIDKKANPNFALVTWPYNAPQDYLLHVALRGSILNNTEYSKKIAELLCKTADVHQEGFYGDFPLHTVIRHLSSNRHLSSCIGVLLSRGADPMRRNRDGISSLGVLFYSVFDGPEVLEVAKVLLGTGTNIHRALRVVLVLVIRGCTGELREKIVRLLLSHSFRDIQDLRRQPTETLQPNSIQVGARALLFPNSENVISSDDCKCAEKSNYLFVAPEEDGNLHLDENSLWWANWAGACQTCVECWASTELFLKGAARYMPDDTNPIFAKIACEILAGSCIERSANSFDKLEFSRAHTRQKVITVLRACRSMHVATAQTWSDHLLDLCD